MGGKEDAQQASNARVRWGKDCLPDSFMAQVTAASGARAKM